MEQNVRFQVNGLKELLETFNQLEAEFGQKDARRTLQKAVLSAMKEEILPRAKLNAMNHVDTGLLAQSLIATARKPTGRDKRSVYIKPTDMVVGFVQTKPIPKKLKRAGEKVYGKFNTKETRSIYKQEKRKFMESKGYFYDARAIANEFGTAHRAATPFLDPALSEGKGAALVSLIENFKIELQKYYNKKGR